MKKGIASILLVMGLIMSGAGVTRLMADNEISRMSMLETKEASNMNWMLIAGSTMVFSSVIIISIKRS